MTPTELYDEFMRIGETGDEAAIEQFLTAHLAEFPEETRDQIVSAYLKEALTQEADEIRARGDVEKELIEQLDDAKGARSEIENQQRIQDLQKQIGAK